MEEQARRDFARAALLGRAEREKLFGGFWRDYHPRVAVYLRAFPRLRPEDREELAADILLRAFERAGLYDPARPFEPWFYALARNQVLNRLGGLRRGGEGRAADAAPDSAAVDRAADTRMPGPEASCLARETRDFIAAYLEGLHPRERELAFLVHGEGLTLAEAARVTGEPLGTVTWRLSELRKGLRQAWGREYA